MNRPHDPTGAAKLGEIKLSYWRKSHGHADDETIPPGEVRPPDEVLQIAGFKLHVVFRSGQAVFVDERGVTVPIPEFIEMARREGRRVYGCLIATKED